MLLGYTKNGVGPLTVLKTAIHLEVPCNRGT